MDVLEAIFTRKSIRKFTGEPVGEEDLKTILKAGFSAPSAHNCQPWHFVVVKDKTSLESISNFHPYGKMLPNAGCCVAVCGDTEKQELTGFLVEDCAAALQNMLLAAHGLGLGAVWCGIYPVQELMKGITEVLNLPSNIIPVAIMPLGHKDQERTAKDRYDESKVHYNKW